MSLLTKIFGRPNARSIRWLSPLVEAINALEPQMQALSDGELKGLTEDFRRRLTKGETLDDLLPEAFAAGREAPWMGQVYRALGLSIGVLNHEAAYVYDPAHVNPQQKEALDEERDTTGSFRVVHEFLRPGPRNQAYGADITY